MKFVFLLLASFGILSTEAQIVCPDRSALNLVNVTVHVFPKSAGRRYENVNFHGLDQYEMVDVINANVSVLCEDMIKRFPRLKSLTLIKANITEIHPGAFQEVPRLAHLSLTSNNLTEVRKGYFQNLENLKVLYLSANQIHYIEENAFSDLIAIEKLFLDKNKIGEILDGWFLNNRNLHNINLAFNSIGTVQEGAFTLDRNMEIKIQLQHNIIESVTAKAVVPKGEISEEEKPYLTLHLENNQIKDIPADLIQSLDVFHTNLVLNSNKVEWVSNDTLTVLKHTSVALHLVQNPLNCSCVQVIDGFMKNQATVATFYYNTTAECDFMNFEFPSHWREFENDKFQT